MKPRVSLKGRALQLLAQREHSRVELRRKLLLHAGQEVAAVALANASADPSNRAPFSRRVPPTPEMHALVDELLDGLVAGGHLSEARFVEGRVRVRAARHGKLRIQRELAQHGLALSPAETQALDDSEFARARQVWQRKFGEPAADAAGRARQMRFLAARGFAADVIRRVVQDDAD